MKPIKLNFPEDKIFVSSDWHWNHHKGAAQQFIVEARGFKTIQEHNQNILNCIDAVPDDSMLIYLGDAALNSTDQEIYQLLKKVNDKFKKVIWIYGNHRHGEYRVLNDYKKDFPNIEAHFYLEVNIGGKLVCLHHFPAAVWNSCHHNSFSLVGHSHGSYPPSRPDNFEQKQLDCGLDCAPNHGFWKFSEIRLVMAKKGVQYKDHHNSETT